MVYNRFTFEYMVMDCAGAARTVSPDAPLNSIVRVISIFIYRQWPHLPLFDTDPLQMLRESGSSVPYERMVDVYGQMAIRLVPQLYGSSNCHAVCGSLVVLVKRGIVTKCEHYTKAVK